jgi:cell division protein YceG involved in septum cleavage
MARGPARRAGGGSSLLFWIVALAGAAAVFLYFFFTSAMSRPGPSAEDRAFMVERGASGAAIANALENEGFITDDLLFRIANRLYANGATLQAGE